MSTYALSDSATMLRRDFRHMRRYPVMTISTVLTPTAFLLLFVYVFGGAIGAGLGGASYVNYIVPGILMMTVGSGCAATAVGVNADMTEGIVARFRTMAISRASVLTGQVIGSLIRTMMSIIIVLGLALLMGFRPTASLINWIEALSLIALFTFAVSWMGVVFGLVGKTPAGANSLSLIFVLLPFISSAFVRAESMPVGIRWFAEYQPFTPIIDTLRGLLLGTPIGNSAILAIAWCAAIALVGYLLARAIYNRDPVK